MKGEDRLPWAALSPKACAVASEGLLVLSNLGHHPKTDPSVLSLEPAQLEAAPQDTIF